MWGWVSAGILIAEVLPGLIARDCYGLGYLGSPGGTVSTSVEQTRAQTRAYHSHASSPAVGGSCWTVPPFDLVTVQLRSVQTEQGRICAEAHSALLEVE